MNNRLMQWIILTPALVACGGGGKTSESEGSTTAQTATDASAGTGETTAVTGSGTTAGSASNSGTSSGDPTTSGSSTSASGSSSGPGETTDGTTTKGETTDGTTSGETTDGTTKGETTDGTTKGETTDGTTKGETTNGETGNLCVDQQGSCANGEMCCPGLECCAGVPVPPGKEFCSNNCPISDRTMKTDFRPIDAAEVLQRVVGLEISTWRYKKDGPEVRHLGPMAQDFKQAFGLWDTDRMIFPLDATGVSMAAIQALHRRVVEAEEENTALRARLDRLEKRLVEMDR